MHWMHHISGALLRQWIQAVHHWFDKTLHGPKYEDVKQHSTAYSCRSDAQLR